MPIDHYAYQPLGIWASDLLSQLLSISACCLRKHLIKHWICWVKSLHNSEEKAVLSNIWLIIPGSSLEEKQIYKMGDSYLTLYSRYKHYKVEEDNFMTGQFLSKNRFYNTYIYHHFKSSARSF